MTQYKCKVCNDWYTMNRTPSGRKYCPECNTIHFEEQGEKPIPKKGKRWVDV